MHAIVESRPGDDAALYPLGNEQQVQETTEHLANLAEGAQHVGFYSPASESQASDRAIVDSFQAALVDPFREPHKLPGETGIFALSMLTPASRAKYDSGYVEATVERVDNGVITFEDAEESVTRFEAVKDDVTILDENGYEGYVTDGRVEPLARTIIWADTKEEFLKSTRYEVFASDGETETELGISADEALDIMNAQSETIAPVPSETIFTEPKEKEVAVSVGAIAFSKQFDIEWAEDGTPTLSPNRPHTLLWQKSVHKEIAFDMAATILSPDHPVRQPRQ